MDNALTISERGEILDLIDKHFKVPPPDDFDIDYVQKNNVGNPFSAAAMYACMKIKNTLPSMNKGSLQQ